MKRSLLILVATAAVWTGCSKTETIDQPQGMAIGFTNAYIGNPVESKAVQDRPISLRPMLPVE